MNTDQLIQIKKLHDALDFANWVHRNQKRKMSDTPYIVHPLETVIVLQSHGISADNENGLDVLIAASTHDTIEDNPLEVSIDEIRSKFGRGVANIVAAVTLDPKNPDKRASRAKILKSGWKVRIVKTADILCNTLSLTRSLQINGLADTQRHFNQPVADRILMESEFLKDVYQDDDQCGALLALSHTALEALLDLKIVSERLSQS